MTLFRDRLEACKYLTAKGVYEIEEFECDLAAEEARFA